MIKQFLSWNNKHDYVGDVVRMSVANIIYQIFYIREQNASEDKQFSALLEKSDEINRFARNGNLLDAMPWLRFFMPWDCENSRPSSSEKNLSDRKLSNSIRYKEIPMLL